MAVHRAAGLGGRRIAITGGEGLIGGRLVQHLLAAGAGVELLGPTALIAGSSALHESLLRCDSLVHLEYRSPAGPGFWADLAGEIAANLLPTVRLLEAADRARIRFVCFASSVSVYPNSLRWASEDGPVDRTGTPDAFVKLEQESCVRKWARLTGCPASILRLATVYGPGEWVPRAIPNFIRSVLAGKPPVVEGRGSRPFDLIFVADVVRAFRLALEHRHDTTFNIGTGFGRSSREVAALIIRLCEARLEIVENLSVPERASPIGIVSRAASELGFKATTLLEAGLAEEIRWFREEGAISRKPVIPAVA